MLFPFRSLFCVHPRKSRERVRARARKREQDRMLAHYLFSLFLLHLSLLLCASRWLFAVVVFPLYSFNFLLSLSLLSLSFTRALCHSRACTLKAFLDAPRLHFLYFITFSHSLTLVFRTNRRAPSSLSQWIAVAAWMAGARTHTVCFIKLHKLVYGGQSHRIQHLFCWQRVTVVAALLLLFLLASSCCSPSVHLGCFLPFLMMLSHSLYRRWTVMVVSSFA